jgi:hypothetical protein
MTIPIAAGEPVTIVASGGLPVSESAQGTPMTPTTTPGAVPVTIVASGGQPVRFIGLDHEHWPNGVDPTP